MITLHRTKLVPFSLVLQQALNLSSPFEPKVFLIQAFSHLLKLCIELQAVVLLLNLYKQRKWMNFILAGLNSSISWNVQLSIDRGPQQISVSFFKTNYNIYLHRRTIHQITNRLLQSYLRYQCTPNDNLAQSLLHGHMFHITPNKVYIF